MLAKRSKRILDMTLNIKFPRIIGLNLSEELASKILHKGTRKLEFNPKCIKPILKTYLTPSTSVKMKSLEAVKTYPRNHQDQAHCHGPYQKPPNGF